MTSADAAVGEISHRHIWVGELTLNHAKRVINSAFLGLNRLVGQSPPTYSSHPDVHEQKRALLAYAKSKW